MVLGSRGVIVVEERKRTVDKSVLPGVYFCVSRKSRLKAVRTSRRDVAPRSVWKECDSHSFTGQATFLRSLYAGSHFTYNNSLVFPKHKYHLMRQPV
jgi:hypothetical protein